MIIPPSPTNPRSPLRRALRIVGLALAPVLLVAVVGVGIAGPKPEPAPTPRPAEAAAVSPEPAFATPAPLPSTTPLERFAAFNRPSFPDSFAGLDAATPEQALVRRAAGHGDGAVVVQGWLKVDPPAGGCSGGDLGSLGPWCARTGTLAQRAWAVMGADFDPLPAHLHVTIPVGVRLPDPLIRMATAAAGPPLPVLVVGRFAGTRCDPADLTWCEEPFVVDRIAWADGIQAPLTPLADDRLATARRRPNPFTADGIGSRTPLLAVLSWPATISGIDPATATSIGRLPETDPVWYLRVVGKGGRDDAATGGTPGVRWILLDELRMGVLATGRTSVTAEAATVAATRAGTNPFPTVQGGLGVLSLRSILTASASRSARPTAVSGYLRDVRVTGPCTGPRDPGRTLCERTGRLSPGMGDAAAARGIAVSIPAGVRVPRALLRAGAAPAAVVVLGRATTSGSDCDATTPCEASLTVDRVAWVNGAEAALRPVLHPALDTRTRTAALAVRAHAERVAAGPSGTVLVTALVHRRDVAALDPAASALVEATVPSTRPVWYVRAIQTRYGSQSFQNGDVPPRVTAAVIDAVSGDVLAWGAG